MKYIVRDEEAGNIIEEFDSFEEAEKRIEEFEYSDKEEDVFEKDFYEIVCRCEICGELVYPDEINLDKYCLDCFLERYVECDDCGKAMKIGEDDYVHHYNSKSTEKALGDVWYLCRDCASDKRRYSLCECGKTSILKSSGSLKSCNLCKNHF